MTFRVGQKVVCVDAAPILQGNMFVDIDGSIKVSSGDMGGLTKGTVYTITSIIAKSHGTALILAEITRQREPGFSSHRFRPVVERKTDISVFTEILRKSTKPARTPAMSQHQRGSENV